MTRLQESLRREFERAAAMVYRAVRASEEGYFFVLPEGSGNCSFFQVGEYDGRCCRVFFNLPRRVAKVEVFYYQPYHDQDLEEWLSSMSAMGSLKMAEAIFRCLCDLVATVGLDVTRDALLEAVATSVMEG